MVLGAVGAWAVCPVVTDRESERTGRSYSWPDAETTAPEDPECLALLN
jgi:hypothetical protein